VVLYPGLQKGIEKNLKKFRELEPKIFNTKEVLKAGEELMQN